MDSQKQNAESISLAGQWSFRLDPENAGAKQQWFNQDLDASVTLPGTLDTNKKGTKNTAEAEFVIDNLKHLTRKYDYTGAAWYQKQITIPKAWAGKKISLSLERVLWESTIWIDGRQIASQDSLVTPHVYDITKFATAGEHTLSIRIDNSYKYNIGSHPNFDHPIGHAYTDETQTVWNGIIGQIALGAVDKVYISDVQVYPDLQNRCARLKIVIANESGQSVKGQLTLTAQSKNTEKKHNTDSQKVDFGFSKKEHTLNVDYSMGDNFLKWDEFSPALYDLQVSFTGKTAQGDFTDEKQISFGMREFSKDKDVLTVNGHRVFLRGTLECCIFPLTGHPPTEIKDWMRILKIAASYGLNHLRFHSWCPPKAAFTAADMAGFYLQVELPVWVPNAGQDTPRDEFIRKEGHRILREYGNHPSFCLMSMGNEMIGDFSYLHDLVTDFKNKDPRRLYTSTTFSFQEGHGKWPEEVDDYFISQQTIKGWVRGQGFVNQNRPSTDFDFAKSIEGLPVPIVTHEIGQSTVYPNIDEIDKYTGVLKPLNFMAIKKDLKEKGLLKQAPDFTKATGKFGVELYKTDIELALRTSRTSGFQMLDLHDFPGQGTALIGVLDAFWDSKGLIEPEGFRRFCNATVPLARMPKRVYYNNETFDAAVEIAHFGPEPLKGAQVIWAVRNECGDEIASGAFDENDIPIGSGIKLGDITVALDAVKKAGKLNLEVRIKDTDFVNDWNFWVYPSKLQIDAGEDIVVAESLDENVKKAIGLGKKILLLPKPSLFKDKIPGRFVPVFWSPVHFKNQPGTMGILCNPQHPALESFPTDFYTDWQWWDLNINSVVFKLDEMPKDIEPIVQIIDNFSRNHKLATVIELNVGGADMIICSMDLVTDLDERPQAKQLRYSLLKYMESGRFSPKGTMKLQQLEKFFNKTTAMTNASLVYADSIQPGYSAENVMDNNPKTIWSTAWSGRIKKHPHEIIIDLCKEYEIRGFTYLPRQDGNTNGWINEYEFYVGDDGKNWNEPAAKGNFKLDDSLKKVILYSAESVYSDQSVKGRYIRFVARKGFGDDPYTTIARLDVITD